MLEGCFSFWQQVEDVQGLLLLQLLGLRQPRLLLLMRLLLPRLWQHLLPATAACC